jgi:predicted Zn-dependent peptidase
MDKVYNVMGGAELNAHTSVEETVYQVSLPANRLEAWAAIEADRFQHPVFRLFPTELEAVFEEKNTSLDNKERIIQEAVDKLLYTKHPYGQRTVLGDPEDLKKPSIKNIEHFFDQWYGANNLAITLSGDIDKDEAIKTIDAAFSKLERRDTPAQRHWDEPKLDKRESVSVNYEGEEFVLLAFRTEPNSAENADTLHMIDMILDNATAGLINLNLNGRQKVRHAGAFPMLMNDYGAEYLYGIPKEGQSLEEVEKLLLEQVDLLKRGEFEDWIIPGIILDFKKTRKSGLESDEARVETMTSSFIEYEPWDHVVQTIARMEKITKDDVVRVANRYFGEGYIAGYRRDAKREIAHVEKPQITPVDIDPRRESSFAKGILDMPFKPLEPVFIDPAKDYKTVEDPNGVKLYYVANPVNDVFTLTLTVDFGLEEDNTIGPATQLLMKSGTAKFSAEELKKEWFKLGAVFGIGASDNETTVTLTGLDQNFEASVALMTDLITQPTADNDTLEILKKIILVQRADDKKQPESVAGALSQFHRYGAESSFLRQLPNAAIQELTKEQLHGAISKLLNYKHVYGYTGSLPIEKVQAILNAKHPVKTPLQDPPPFHFRKVRQPEKDEIYFFNKETTQANVRLEFGGQDYDEALIPPVQVFNEYFGGGMASIVFQDLRESRALAYYAGARYVPGYRAKDQDVMIGAILTQTDKALDALREFLTIMDKMPASSDRFQVAREAILNQYRGDKIGFRSVINTVKMWERHNLTPDPRRVRLQAIEAETLDKLVAFQRTYIADKPKLISIVGDSKVLDLEKIKAMGPVKEIGVDDIFVK